MYVVCCLFLSLSLSISISLCLSLSLSLRSSMQRLNAGGMPVGKRGQPLKLHIPDDAPMDFESYQRALFENDPFDFKEVKIGL